MNISTASQQPTPTRWRPEFLYGPSGGQSPSQHGPAVSLKTVSQSVELLRQEMLNVLQEGLRTDLVARPHLLKLERQLSFLQAGQLESLKTLLNNSRLRVEQIFILKAFAANEPWSHLVQYAQEMRGLAEDQIIRRSTMRDARDLVQQWQDSCGPTLLQVAAGEADPRYAWELNKTWDLSAIDPLGNNQALAEQQKRWLEQYGGRAVQRGATGGTGIAISQMLNEQLTPVTGARYQISEVKNKSAALNDVAAALANGHDVPLRVSWDPPGAASDSGHFVLAMAVRQGYGGREFHIHDPWTGKSVWVTEREIHQDRMSPFFDKYARLSHIYQPQPL